MAKSQKAENSTWLTHISNLLASETACFQRRLAQKKVKKLSIKLEKTVQRDVMRFLK